METGPLVSVGSSDALEGGEGTGQGLGEQGWQLCRRNTLRSEHNRKL